MPILNIKMVGYVAAGLLALYLLKKNGMNLVQGAAAGVAGAAVDVVDDVASGTVIGIGEVFGIPPTNETECQRARREGRTWDASFSCDLPTWFRYLTNSGA